ncbi:MAG: NADH:flavin oxidoreductase/NADH oxidase family protein [Xanthomonadales bacterium]|nr:NADH:flavin oxidoreductase/NADH oxidase family protein [Gammaproteobacteria bacterium]MBT8053400.1 NADH:flavin oxidoreductase/NADH oxidase family protein [Gammaproteobacteria bacterium]NND57453.1 NADH:flavin oxidoreductase/NADH oxidase family protein [Xanthomonadales bacterium]NNK52085.1 NADH:flavin oxidoreductase/NADH oxidase family protein [Xanthomonadales bacterium]
MKNGDLHTLNQPLTLPCGTVMKNRMVKAAMTEGLAAPDGLPNERHAKLYRTWAEGGCAVLITGNVMIDGSHLERPGNVILDHELDEAERSAFSAWAEAGSAEGCQVWMQLSHPGRQTPKSVNPHPKSASDIKLRLPGGQFARPEPLTTGEIGQLVERFAAAALTAKECGFSGVQIHGAHGYLISQFLSPSCNRREDEWGGSIENRARFLRKIVSAVREKTGRNFAISVKLNSSDFQKGGFGPEDARQVVKWLQEGGVDLIEISGGTYEQPRMLEFEGIEPVQEIKTRASTRAREAFFLAFAAELAAQARAPLMVTGGFRTAAGMAEAIAADGISAIGVGRPMCGDPGCVGRMLKQGADLPRFEKSLGSPRSFLGVNSPIRLIKIVASFSVMAWYYDQIVLLGDGLENDPDTRTFTRFLALQGRESKWMKARRAWLEQQRQVPAD